MRLPEAALKFRTDNNLLSIDNLRRLNITAWLYRDRQGVEGIKVNPNATIAELQAQFGPADTRDAEVGIHSGGRAAEFFRTNRDLTVLQIFTETSETAVAAGTAEQTLVRVGILSERADTFIRMASSEGEAEQVIEEILKAAGAMP